MHILALLGAAAPLLSTTAARQFDIPAVDQAVQQALIQKGNIQAYSGPVAASNATNSTATHGPPVHVNAAEASGFWLESMQHQGVAPYTDGGYSVWRNVKDYGAHGDGSTDDTAAIVAAISAGNRCGKGCGSSTVTPALVYFPAGTYIISSPIFDEYYTQMIGDADSMPTIKASAGFQGGYMIDSDPYFTSNLNWVSTNVFFRQIRNLQFDTTAVPPTQGLAAVHWPTAQATSIQNCVFNLNSQDGTVHQGIFTESGSAGFVGDLTFNGGAIGWSTGNQQFTARNLVFNGCKTAISHYWDWSYTYSGLSVNNCDVGIDISAGGSSSQEVGSILVVDSTFSGVNTAIKTSWTTNSAPASAGSVILENVVLNNVGTAVQNNGGTALGGGSTTIAGWGQGHQYASASSGMNQWSGTFTPNSRPGVLTQGGSNFYARSKPTYSGVDASNFVSARSSGARGDSNTDDTAALQNAINSAASSGKILFLDAGYYRVTDTITIPAGAKIVGEAFPVILSSGGAFSDINNPRPVVKVGKAGDSGTVEWSDTIVSTQGAQAGATLVEYNLASSSPSGMWDVHVRVGGFTGSNLQVAQCPTSSAANDGSCIGAYMLMHITSAASGLFMENNWFWTADHDADDQGNTQVTVYSGRGMLVESSGPVWLSSSSVEHNVFYQYQFLNAQNVYAGFIQTETPYYMPNPPAPGPFPINGALNDPDFACSNGGTCAEAWGLRAVNSKDIYVYGGGFYSFFNTYSTTCSDQGNGEHCQDSIIDLENSSVSFYNLNTIGAQNMVISNGQIVAHYSDNENVYPDTVALLRV